MKKILSIILGLIVYSSLNAQQVIIKGDNLTRNNFSVTIVVDRDTISQEFGFKNSYQIRMKDSYNKIMVHFSSTEFTKTLCIYPSDKKLWVNLDIELNDSSEASLLYDPQYKKYVIIKKEGSTQVLN